jgi:hypothetical protein
MQQMMFEVMVKVSDGCIYVEQDSSFHETQSIQVHPDQVDILINWLKEAKEEAINSVTD